METIRSRVDGAKKNSFDSGFRRALEVSNCSPIACLPVMWKLLTGIIGEKLYHTLERDGMPADEEMGYRKGFRGVKDQLFVDKAILTNCRRPCDKFVDRRLG